MVEKTTCTPAEAHQPLKTGEELALTLKALSDEEERPALRFVAGIAAYQVFSDAIHARFAYSLAQANGISLDVTERWTPALARNLWNTGQHEAALQISENFVQALEELLLLPEARQPVCEFLLTRMFQPSTEADRATAWLEQLILIAPRQLGLDAGVRLLGQISTDEDKHFRIGVCLAKLEQPNVLRSFAEDANASPWLRMKASAWLAQEFPTEPWLEKLVALCQLESIPHKHRTEGAVALLALGHPFAMDLVSKLAENPDALSRLCGAIFNLERPDLLERVLRELKSADTANFCVDCLKELGAMGHLSRLARDSTVVGSISSYAQESLDATPEF